jgi:hypothetical protein
MKKIFNPGDEQKLMDYVNDHFKQPKIARFGVGDAEFSIEIYSTIPISARMELVERVVSLVFSKTSGSTEEYTPALTEFAKRYNIFSYYTNLVLPTNVDDAWLVLNDAHIYETILNEISEEAQTVLEEADLAIKTKIDYLTNKTDFTQLVEKITGVISSLVNELSGTDINQVFDIFKNLPNVSTSELVKSILEKDKNSDGDITKKEKE